MGLLADWAYDIACSRAVEGNFGQGGVVRYAIGATLLSMVWATAPCLHCLMTNSLAIDIPPEAAMPLVASAAFLVSTLIGREPEIAFIPWIDFANHRSGKKAIFEYDLFGDAILFKAENKVSASGEQWVTFDYGGASNGITNDFLL
eukprot:10293235-Ditylum_brightwellii.AAC.1